ncbi:MAG: trigger factor [Actinomycetota bacterium]|nr:trigger factor [Actinomycetota bacterium]
MPLSTTTEELEDSRVRVRVEVGPEQLEQELRNAAQELGKDFKVSGFRQGKVPPQVVLQRVGREAVLDEAVRRGMPGWYEEALHEAGVAAVGDPKVDLLQGLPDAGAPLAFTIEVGVRPPARLGDYRGVEVGRREPEVAPEELDQELERIRESAASLETVEREAAHGDFVVVDFTGYVDGEAFEGGEARGYLLELGSGRLIEGFEEQLVGASAGEEREVEVPFPEEYGNEDLAGKVASFAVSVKEVKEKRLPELDDDFAIEAGGYDSVDELRSEIEGRLRERDEEAIEREFREAAVDAVAAEAQIDVPHDLVHSKAHEMWRQTAHRLRHQGVDPEQYLQLTGKDEEQLIAESEPDAERALRREAVLAAVVEAEKIEVTDDELMNALREASTEPGKAAPSEKALTRSLKKARARGQDDALREDIAMRRAVDLVVESATPISVEQAEAKGKLWTPGKDAAEPAGELWTPGS